MVQPVQADPITDSNSFWMGIRPSIHQRTPMAVMWQASARP